MWIDLEKFSPLPSGGGPRARGASLDPPRCERKRTDSALRPQTLARSSDVTARRVYAESIVQRSPGLPDLLSGTPGGVPKIGRTLKGFCRTVSPVRNVHRTRFGIAGCLSERPAQPFQG